MPTLAFAGDVLIQRVAPLTMLAHVAPILRAADASCVNLEGPACDCGDAHPDMYGAGRMHIRSSPGAIDALVDAGIDVATLANNHALNYGAEGLAQTLRLLDRAGIARTGAGMSAAEAHQPAILRAGDVTVAILAYTSVCMPAYRATPDSPGVAMVRAHTRYEANPRLEMQPGSPQTIRSWGHEKDVARLGQDIRCARAAADLVVVCWHWGISERWGKLAEYQVTLGHLAIDAGADAVIGHHAHMLMGIEHYRERPIFYSIGNFAMDMTHPYFRPESLIVELDVQRSGIRSTRLVPLMIGDSLEPKRATDARAVQRIGWMLELLSEGLNTTFDTSDGMILACAGAS